MSEDTAAPGEPSELKLAGPEALAARQSSLRGPFAGRNDRIILAAIRFNVVNAGTVPAMIGVTTLDPLRRDDGGTIAPGKLAITGLTGPIPPGGSVVLTLTGHVPATPGQYRSTVRIGDSLAIPVTLAISAAPAWGVLCMLLGLALLGLINLLEGESAVATSLHDALQARQDIRAVLETHPAPQSRATDVDTMDQDFDAAIAALGRRRRPSFVDHRETDAKPLLDEAGRLATKLQADLSSLPPGTAEIEDLHRAWTDVQATLQRLAALPPTLPAQPEQGLAGKLDVFLANFSNQILRAPATLVVAETNTELGRIALEQSAGENDTARALALNTRLWLQRSARFLGQQVTLFRTAVVQANWMVSNERIVRARAAQDDMAPEDRQAVLSLLDQAVAQLDHDTDMQKFRDANHLVNTAWTAEVKAEANIYKQRVGQAIAAAHQQTDYGDVQALQDQLLQAKPLTPDVRRAGIQQILALFQTHIDRVADPTERQDLQHRLDAMQAIAKSEKLADISPPYKAFLNEWAAYGGRLTQQALDRLDRPRCLSLFADMQRSASNIEATLRQLPASPTLDGWDRSLDQIRQDMQRHGPDAEAIASGCIDPLLAINQRINDLSGTIFAATLADVPMPAASRLQAARNSGIVAAIEAVAAKRNLRLDIVTPPDERVVGRNTTFAAGNLDPVWGAATTIHVDFGDGKPAFAASAEAIRTGRRITHSYGTPLTGHLTITATDASREAIGQGTNTILVKPSPASSTQALADEFFNVRFSLALLIALTAYYWRYHSRATTFGARHYDYVEAFTLGFAVDAAVSHLPQAIAALAG